LGWDQSLILEIVLISLGQVEVDKINCNCKGNLRRNHYDNFSDNDKTTDLTLHFHYKNEALGTKAVVYSENLLEKKVDTLKGVVGEKIAFLKWGNAIFKKKKEIYIKLIFHVYILPDDKDFKKIKRQT
jgi:hypothetical protein